MVGGVADLSHLTRRPGLMAGLKTGMVLGVALTVWLLGPGPMAPYRRALLNRSAPQMVLVLGGDVDRERMGARLARQLDLPLLVSGGSNREYATWLLQEERLNPVRVTLDYRAPPAIARWHIPDYCPHSQVRATPIGALIALPSAHDRHHRQKHKPSEVRCDSAKRGDTGPSGQDRATKPLGPPPRPCLF
jgi:hypothetical protein